MNKFCCDNLSRWTQTNSECPYPLIHRTRNAKLNGISIMDGHNSFVLIGFCPWCGTKLPGNEPGLNGQRMREAR